MPGYFGARRVVCVFSGLAAASIVGIPLIYKTICLRRYVKAHPADSTSFYQHRTRHSKKNHQPFFALAAPNPALLAKRPGLRLSSAAFTPAFDPKQALPASKHDFGQAQEFNFPFETFTSWHPFHRPYTVKIEMPELMAN